MKQCPACQSTFDDRVDFCFQDGTPLAEADLVADPTALPDKSEVMPVAANPKAVPKAKRSRSGMFARPSVADMLSVPQPGVVPPAGGNRVVQGAVEDAVQALEEAPTLIVEPVVAIPDLAMAQTVIDEGRPPPSISVPVSAIAVDVPRSDIEEDEPTQAPPGFEPEVTALDDSWFGDGEEKPGGETTQPVVEAKIEDPGFADVTEPSIESSGIGFDDSSWSVGGVSSTQGSKKWFVIGAVVLAACVLVSMQMSGGDPTPLPTPPVINTQTPPPPPMAPEVPDMPEMGPDDVEVGTPETPEPEAKTPPAVAPAPIPVPVPVPVPVPKSAKPAPAASAPAAKPASPKAARTQDRIPSPWTGAPAAAQPPAAPAAASANPWGASTDTPSRGRLTITTDPAGAMVYVDDRRIGKSPTRTEVNFGTHKIRVELSDYAGTARTVNVQATEVSVPFRMELAKIVGRCNLLGSPGSIIVMNGRSIGSIPITVDCEPGSHSFKVTPSGGATFSVSRSVSFGRAGETANVFLTP